MKNICPICKEEKDNVGPKYMGQRYIDPEPPFTQKQLVVDTRVMCNDCLDKFKNGEIVDKILAITKSSDYLDNAAKKEEIKEYEKQIDQMVYKLYDLTLEEIAIMEEVMN